MAVTPTPVFAQGFVNSFVQIVAADASALKTLATAGSNGWRITSINVYSDDTSARDLTFYITNGGTDYPQATIAIPITAGISGTIPSINILGQNYYWPSLPYDNSNNRYIDLASGSVLKVKSLTTVTAAKTITITALGVTL